MDPRSGDLTVGDVVRRFRERAGMSARELGLAAGLSESYVGKLEKGEVRDPSLASFARLAVVLGLNQREIHALVVNEGRRHVRKDPRL